MNVPNPITPLIPAHQSLPEITLRVFILGALLTALLAASNVYLGLKLGTTIAASIPAAVISMSVLRFFKNYNPLENNIVQTMASAGEAVAAATGFVLPALIMIGYWQHFHYGLIVCLVITGGLLGVLVSVPLRRVMLNHLQLPYPEGTAVGHILKASAAGKTAIKPLWQGSLVGGFLGLCQTGFQVLSDNLQIWFITAKSTLFGVGLGFSPALVGAGYIIGPRIAMNLLAGVVIGWIIGIPVLSHVYGLSTQNNAYAMATNLWQHHLRFIGVGTMLLGGCWTLLSLLKPIYQGMAVSFQFFKKIRQATHNPEHQLPRTERDIPIPYLLWGLLVSGIIIFAGTFYLLQNTSFASNATSHYGISLMSALYALLGGFVIASITAYTSGLLGMTNTPLSGLLLVSVLLFSCLFLLLFDHHTSWNANQLATAMTIVLLTTVIVSIVSAISGENLQDLKAGQIVGATPWKQQVILLAGAMVAAIVVGPVLELLYQAYGMGGAFPRAGMNTAQMLPAPQAGLIAATTQGIFGHSLDWIDIYIGIGVAAVCIVIDAWLKAHTQRGHLSVLAVGLGIYLPPEVLLPTVIGGCVYWLAQRTLMRRSLNTTVIHQQLQSGNLLACGLVAGAALMGIFLAVPFVLEGSSDALKLVSDNFKPIANGLGMISLLALCVWIYRLAIKLPHDSQKS